MKRWSVGRLLTICGISLLLWAAAALACLFFGSTGAMWKSSRLEPVLLSSLIGAALASAGVVYQAILRNPLADPYLLGVSSGATLAVYLWSLPLAAGSALMSSFSQQTFSFVGALGAVALVFALAQRRGRIQPVTLLLMGVIVNAVAGSVFLLLYHLRLRGDQTETTGGAFRIIVGSIQTNLTLEQMLTSAVVVSIGWIAMLAMAGKLNVASLGEAEAQSLGVRIQRLRWTAMILASLVTASAIAISGPIGFIGLVCPHLGRLLVGNDQRRLLPIATAIGAAVLAIGDTASRALTGPLGTQLPVGVLTGLLGGPFFLWLLSRRRGEEAA